MRVIILAAGYSVRFQQENFTVPKALLMIDWRGTIQSMLAHVLGTIPAQYDQISVAVPAGWLHEAKKVSSIPTYQEIMSRGPADTALQMINGLTPDNTLIMDVDVINWTNDLYRLTQLSCCGVLVSWSANPSFSYVDKIGTFNTVVEKKRISEYAVRGAYYVPSTMINEFILRLQDAIAQKQEPYVSHAFNYMTEEKFSLLTSYTPIEWGTPRDVRISGAHIITEKGKIQCT